MILLAGATNGWPLVVIVVAYLIFLGWMFR
jgi:hypothetical protein